MKKAIVLLALSLVSIANAQKGSVLVMGSVGYISEQGDSHANDTDRKAFSFNPKIGYQFTDNWTVGIESMISNDKYEANPNNYLIETNNYSIGSFVRYTEQLGEIFAFYTDLGAGYQNKKSTNSSDSSTTQILKGNGFYIGLQPQIRMKIKKIVDLNFGIGGITYNSINYDNKTTYRGLNINLGQAYYFGISRNFN